MKFLIDADTPRSFAGLLESLDHDVIDIRDVDPRMNDQEIYQLARKQKRIIITRDLGFSNILSYQPQEHFGIIVLKFRMIGIAEMLDIFERFLESINPKVVTHSLIILEEHRFRIKK